MRTLVVLMLLAATVALPATSATTVDCDPNGYGYDCLVHVGPVCYEVEYRFGQPSTVRHCSEFPRDLLP